MINLSFRPRYNAVHLTNEIGKYMIGGIASFIDQMYDEHTEDIGFIHLYDDTFYHDIYIDFYPGKVDILALPFTEAERLSEINADIVFIHFYGLAFSITERLLQNKQLIYVIHSVPTTEPFSADDPFGGNKDIQENFEFLCEQAVCIVCISEAEKNKLVAMYPDYYKKTTVIYNGMKFISEKSDILINNHRNTFGFIGRLDYRKGLRECLKEIKTLDCELKIACGNEDPLYLSNILDYIEAGALSEKVTFYGWCSEERKKAFLESLDALIIPSLYEPFGYVVLEAVNQGTPILCSNNGGPGEIMGDYKYQFDPYIEGDLCRCIKLFMEDSPEVIHQEFNYLDKRCQTFGAENMRNKYMDLVNHFIRNT